MANMLASVSSTRKELRSFGLVIAVALGVCTAWMALVHSTSWVYFAAGSALFALAALAFPTLLLPLQKSWMLLAVCLNWIMTRLLLGLAFYMLVTPIALTARLLGKQFLDRSFGTQAPTYWQPRNEQPAKESYERQF